MTRVTLGCLESPSPRKFHDRKWLRSRCPVSFLPGKFGPAEREVRWMLENSYQHISTRPPAWKLLGFGTSKYINIHQIHTRILWHAVTHFLIDVTKNYLKKKKTEFIIKMYSEMWRVEHFLEPTISRASSWPSVSVGHRRLVLRERVPLGISTYLIRDLPFNNPL